jgi:predicted HTH domain antitoxin
MVGQSRCGLQQEVLRQYSDGKISAGRGAEILGISLRGFLDLLEREGVAINWDFEEVRRYKKHSES